MALFETLNTRELAGLIWGIIFIISILFIKGVAGQVKELLRLFFQQGILMSIAIIMLFSGCCIWILYRVGFWDISLYKDTVLWFLAVPFLTMFNIRKVSEDKKYFENSIKELFAFSAIADVLINAYTFSLLVELILVVTCFTLMLTVSEKITRYTPVRNLLKNMLFLIGLAMVAYSMIQIIRHFKQFASWETLNTFLLPQLLTVLYLPFVFLILLYMEYDFSFKLLPRAIKDEQLFKQAKRMAIINFGLNWKALKRWRGNIFKYGDITNRAALNETFSHHHALSQLEKNPPEIPKQEGWSPYQAKSFLHADGITTGDYDRIYEDAYFATSEYKKLNPEAILPNTMVYTIEGDMKAANKLTLSFTVHTSFSKEDEVPILYYTKTLLRNAVGKELPLEMELAIIGRRNSSLEDDLYRYTTENHSFQKSKNGYFTSFAISLKNAPYENSS